MCVWLLRFYPLLASPLFLTDDNIIIIWNFGVVAERATFAVISPCRFYCYGGYPTVLIVAPLASDHMLLLLSLMQLDKDNISGCG